ncbi:MAG: tyrosine-type recombinase/integrase [Acutalibacteraceae bacterium]|nr:tyrosine-type recombinase/integrase [Acutalibacteraceae bacterium]
MGKNLKGKELGRGFSQRKDGRYEARAVIEGVKIDIYDTNLSNLKKRFEQEKIRVLRKEKNDRSGITFGEWFDEWFTTCKSPQLKNDACRKRYYNRVKNTFLEILANKKMENISQINIQDAVNELIEKGYTARIVRDTYGIVKECFNTAVINHIITFTPCDNIKLLSIDTKKEVRFLEHWEQDLFLQEAKPTYFYEAYCVLLLTGMRIGEFAGLQWQDIDFNRKTITISRSLSTQYIEGKKYEMLGSPKTKTSCRVIPFMGDVEKYLKQWKTKQDAIKSELGDRWRLDAELGDLVFTNSLGSPTSRYVLAHNIEALLKNLRLKEDYNAKKEGRPPREIKHIHPHTFRHTFATRCFEKKLDPSFVQQIMGHSDYSVTLHYTHLVEDMLLQECKKAGKLID